MSDSRRTMRHILITGATGAIGGALAVDWAAAGVTLHLHGRNRPALEALAEQCRARGAATVLHSPSLTDHDELRRWIIALDEEVMLDIAVAAAGVNTHSQHEDGEQWEQVKELMELNFGAPIALTNCLAERMKQRGRGQIVLMSSLAGYFGLPVTPAYSASKAGIKAYGEAMRGWLAPYGVKLNVVMPGYVSSKMCNEMPGPKPLLWTPARASRRIRRGLERNQARISFPFPLNFGCWWLAVLPAAISQWIVGLAGYNGDHS